MKTFASNFKMLSSILLLIIFFLSNESFAQSRTSTASGNWNSASTWAAANITRTGTVSCSTGSTTVTGSGTSFLTELTVGSVIQRNSNGAAIGTVASITSNTSLTLTANAGSSQTNQAYRTASGPPSPVDAVTVDNGDAVTLNISATCASLSIANGNSASSLTISGSNSLTVSGGISIGAGTGNNDNKTLAVGAGSVTCTTITISAAGSSNRSSGVSISTGSVTTSGSITMGDTNDDFRFTDSGVLYIGGTGTMTGGTLVTSTGTINYNGTNQTIGAYTYNNLTVSGSGTKTVSSNITVNSNLSIEGTAELVPNASNRINNSAPIEFKGGTYRSGATTGYTDQVGVLTLTDNSNIILGTGNHTLTFADSNAASWASGKILTITGWVGSYNGTTAGTNPKIFFGSSNSTLTTAQLNQIQFFNGTANFPATLLSTGELVPLAGKVDNFSPLSLCAGTSVTITGFGFTGVTAVKVNGVNVASYVVNSSTSISAVLATSNTSGTISVVTANGTFSSSSDLTVKPVPTSVTADTSAASVCIGNSISLMASATSNSATAVTLIDEGFNGASAPAGWVTTNTSTNGTVANAAWTLRPNNYNSGSSYGTTISSNDASQFYLSDSDMQGSGSTTNTSLRTPAFSTVGLSAATLTFYHYYKDNSSDYADVQISTDGSSWTTLAPNPTNTYPGSQGAATTFAQATFNLSGYLNQPTVYILFKYSAAWGYYWAIDNVVVSGTYATPPSATYAWTSTPSGYTSSEQDPSGIFPNVPTSYTVTATNNYGCSASVTTSAVAVNTKSTSASITGNASICSGSPSDIHVAITGGVSPYSLVYTDGTSNFTVNDYTSGSNISVAPLSSTTYSLVSVTSANGCAGSGNTGSAALTVDLTTTTNGGISWSNGSPSSAKSVVFDGSSATLNANFNACSLRLKNNATVTVSSGYDVTLNGRLTVESGSTFTLNNNANLLQNNDLTNSGNIVVKRNSSALKRFDYTLWSSPVTGQGIYAFSPFTFANRFYVYRTTTNLYNNSDLGFNITGLDANQVNGTDSNNVKFATGKGYLIRMPWNHPTAPAVWNATFTGVPNNGDVTYTMTNAGAGQRYNLVGNPYPSPISISRFVADNSANITGTLYFWRETNNNTSNNAYCSWAGGTFVSNNEAQVFDPNGIIRTGQGFFVEARDNATSLYFNNEQRSSDHSNQFFRNGNVSNDEQETNRFWLNLTNTSGAFSQMAAGYISNATNGVDVYDGKNINTGDVLLNSILDDTDYAIQGKALPFNPSDVIPLSCKITTAGQYTIAIDHVDGFFADGAQQIYLKDNMTSTIHNLSTGAYSFASESGTFTNRFEIVYQSQLSTPVFTINSVVIYNQNSDFVVNSGNAIMKSIRVFDIRGRLLQEMTGINASQAIINGGQSNEVMLVQVTSEDGAVVTKKVIR